MPSMRDIKRRKVSIQSTQQITKAMKLVSTVKLQRAKSKAEKIQKKQSLEKQIDQSLPDLPVCQAPKPHHEAGHTHPPISGADRMHQIPKRFFHFPAPLI